MDDPKWYALMMCSIFLIGACLVGFSKWLDKAYPQENPPVLVSE